MNAIDAKPESLRQALFSEIGGDASSALRRLVDAASPHGRVYAAGGAVRDLLLGRPLVDIDIVTEGDAIAIVREVAGEARIATHAAFRTASFEAGETWIDVATARRETYARPGALPDVEPADIETDLRRRDFSINAMALRLDGEAELIDTSGGFDDLASQSVRVLHDGSFRDDATRIFRAYRYAARLGFTVEAHTLELIARDAGYIETIGGERLRRELELMIDEDRQRSGTGVLALQAASDAGALVAIHPALRWDEQRTAGILSPTAADGDWPALGFALMAADASVDQSNAIADRLRLKRHEAAAVRGVAAIGQTAVSLLRRPDAKPSGVVVLLDRYPIESVAAFAATSRDAIAGPLALRYLAEWRHIKPILNGNELMQLGVPEGPHVAHGLQLVRAARLDGWASDRDDERALIMRFAKSITDSNAMRGRIDLQFHVN